jgi:hypothetical protein
MPTNSRTRLADAIALPDAAIAVIRKNGVEEGSAGQRWFQRHTAKDPESRLYPRETDNKTAADR